MKTCSKCGLSLPVTSFYKRTSTRLRDDCKECVKERVAKYAAAHPEKVFNWNKQRWERGADERHRHAEQKALEKTAVVSKVCKQCRQEKNIQEFYKDRPDRHCRRGVCKTCQNLNTAVYMKQHADQAKAVAANAVELARVKRQLKSSNIGLRTAAEAFMLKRHMKVLARREVAKFKERARKATRRSGYRLTAQQIKDRFEMFDNRCVYCGVSGPLTVEHVIPLSRGGSNLPANIRPACLSCNASKGGKKLSEWQGRYGLQRAA